MSDWKEKAWGRVRTLCSTADCLVDYLEVIPGGFSSQHRHIEQSNRFLLVSGSVVIHNLTTGKAFDLVEGETVSIPPRHWHRFFSPSGCKLVETYFQAERPRSVEDDIERRTP